MSKTIKLVAIAKDEAAYLPEWIYHHLSVGFDEIEVLVNYTSDNSIDILKKIADYYPVKYRIIDNSIIDYSGNFQMSAYRLLANESSKKFDYLMFLDIDEFWTDTKEQHGIKDVITLYQDPAVLAFQWGIKLESPGIFNPCFSQENNFLPSRFLKVAFKSDPIPEQIYVHKVDISKGRYLFSNGQEITATNKAELDNCLYSDQSLDRYFIVHRVYRSETEYISLLGRGRPRHHDSFNQGSFELKNNRFGYKHQAKNSIKMHFHNADLYQINYQDFIKRCQIQQEIEISKDFIYKRYQTTLLNLINLTEKEKPLLNQVMKGIESIEVKQVLQTIQEKWAKDKKLSKVTSRLRDLAIELEKKNNIESAYQLMLLAKELRNKGPMINKKLKEYEKKLSNEEQ